MQNNSYLWRLYLVSTVLLLFGLGIGYKLFHLQFIDGDKYRKIAQEKTLKSFIVSPVRGNIFSEDGNLLATSKILVNRYNSKLPREIEEIKTLPGVGDYTSNVLAAMIYNKPTLALDGNVKRVISRILNTDSCIFLPKRALFLMS